MSHCTRRDPSVPRLPTHQARLQAFQDAIAVCAPLIEGRTVLDVGCGLGALSMMAAEARGGGGHREGVAGEGVGARGRWGWGAKGGERQVDGTAWGCSRAERKEWRDEC